jgi:peptidoglycan-N-acetylglucosamine deacetylase
MRLCAISVDLDEIRHYYAIHGVSPSERGAENAVYDRALPRYRDFAKAEGLPLTLFAVGADLSRPSNGALLRSLSRAGHEIGNHTFDHLYDLSRRPADDIRAQIERANEVILIQTGQRPLGFRAPGYVMSDAVYTALAECAMQYSSSLFPCPYYHAAKLVALAGQKLRGRVSRSIVDSPRVLGAPRTPYRVGQPYWRSGPGVLELPIQVTPRLRLPFFGTSLTLLGPELARRMAQQLLGQPLINLELHGVDLLDEHDHLQVLAQYQFDLRISLQRKWAVLTAVVAELRAGGYEFVRLDEAARRFSSALARGLVSAGERARFSGPRRSPE